MIQEQVVNISEMEHFLIKSELGHGSGALKWCECDHQCRGKSRLTRSEANPQITTGIGLERTLHQMPNV